MGTLFQDVEQLTRRTCGAAVRVAQEERSFMPVARGTASMNATDKTEVFYSQRAQEFARRLNSVADDNPHIPPLNYGRLVWVQRELQKRYEVKVSPETIRKWFAGETAPRPDKAAVLAKLLEVDSSWLIYGDAPSAGTVQDEKRRNAEVDGVVNMVAGFVRMDGGSIAFPTEGDRRPSDSPAHFFAIIRGAQYGIHVVAAETKGDSHTFIVPKAARENAIVLGVVRRSAFCVDIIEMDAETVGAVGTPKGLNMIVEVSDDLTSGDRSWRKLESFANRL